jgi:hypothetical protein
MLATFDAPDAHVTCARRDRSNTPLQSLVLLNDRVFFSAAQALAARVLSDALPPLPPGEGRGEGAPQTDSAFSSDPLPARIDAAFRICLARGPTAEETARVAQLYQEQRAALQADRVAADVLAAGAPPGADPLDYAAWVGVSRALLNLDEFVTRE